MLPVNDETRMKWLKSVKRAYSWQLCSMDYARCGEGQDTHTCWTSSWRSSRRAGCRAGRAAAAGWRWRRSGRRAPVPSGATRPRCPLEQPHTTHVSREQRATESQTGQTIKAVLCFGNKGVASAKSVYTQMQAALVWVNDVGDMQISVNPSPLFQLSMVTLHSWL